MGRYVVVDTLGAGGMGIVYRARDEELGRDVALKLVGAGLSSGDEGRARLLREAQALAQLSHPNVIAIYDVGRFGEGVFLAMELVEGRRLDAWMKQPRPWREVVAVFREAARGLQAAHEKGLVHRDVKPSNVMIGAEGRVRVLDFGLARAASSSAGPGASGARRAITEDAPTSRGSEEELPPEPNRSSGLHPGARLLESPVTQVGTVIGTPAYMAPEQHYGAVGDARSDQFSFCVALHQALCGERPFAGDNDDELLRNIENGRVRPPPAGVKVPRFLRQVLARGLAADPAQRWPSMAALDEALARDPARQTRRLLVWTGAAGLLGAALLGVVKPALRPCAGAEQRLAGVWDAQRRAAVEKAFLSTGKPFARDAFAAVARSFDGYAQAWVAMHTDACEATQVRRTQSAELLDLRMACLEARLDELKAQVDVLAAADASIVERAHQAAGSLSPLAACADAAALRAPIALPADRARRARVTALEKTLARERALLETGRYPDALALARPASVEARAVGWRPVEADALLLQGRLEELSGDYATAQRTLKDAEVAAEAGRHDTAAARAATSLMWIAGERLGHFPEAHELSRDAEARLERLGDGNALLRADFDAKLGSVFLEEGKLDEALAWTEKALALREEVRPAEDVAVAGSLADLGDILVQKGRYEDALARYRRALALLEKTVGAGHPQVGSLRANLGAALRSLGRFDEALGEYGRARAISDAALPPDHPIHATIAVNVGAILEGEGRLDEALVEYRRALELWTRALGAAHPNVGTARYHLGMVLLAQGKPAEARAELERTLASWETAFGKEHPSLAVVLDGLGQVALERGQLDDAGVVLARAITVAEKALGKDHPELAGPLSDLGRVELARKQPERARPLFERALAIELEHPGEPLELAQTRVGLARAVEKSDRARAHTLAQAALDALAKVPEKAPGAARARADAAALLRR